MATILADTYYLKALECYPWELSEVLENLNYALSYDSNHAASNCLMGVLQMEKLKDFQSAEYYLQQALVADPDYACAYENLIRLYLAQKKSTNAERVLAHVQKVTGVSRVFTLWASSRILELRGFVKLARRNMKAALVECMNTEEHDWIEGEVQRLKSKHKILCKQGFYT